MKVGHQLTLVQLPKYRTGVLWNSVTLVLWSFGITISIGIFTARVRIIRGNPILSLLRAVVKSGRVFVKFFGFWVDKKLFFKPLKTLEIFGAWLKFWGVGFSDKIPVEWYQFHLNQGRFQFIVDLTKARRTPMPQCSSDGLVAINGNQMIQIRISRFEK